MYKRSLCLGSLCTDVRGTFGFLVVVLLLVLLLLYYCVCHTTMCSIASTLITNKHSRKKESHGNKGCRLIVVLPLGIVTHAINQTRSFRWRCILQTSLEYINTLTNTPHCYTTNRGIFSEGSLCPSNNPLLYDLPILHNVQHELQRRSLR